MRGACEKATPSYELLAVPTGFPVGGLYVIDPITGANMARRGEGETPRRFRDAVAAARFIATVGQKPWSSSLFKEAVASLVVQRYGGYRREDWRVSYVLATPAGELEVWPQDRWIACKFVDEALAAEMVHSGSLNPFNGKWNWHALDGDLQQTVHAFAAALLELFNGTPPKAKQAAVVEADQASLF
jgi:hypothetical protein